MDQESALAKASDKAPAFQFYVKDWQSDEHVILMSLAQEGAYLRLLSHQWLHRSIPSDIVAQARICRVSEAEFATLWPGIQPCFKDSCDGRLVNTRLERQRSETDAFSDQMSANGKASVEARRARNGTAQPTRSNGSRTTRSEHLSNDTSNDGSNDTSNDGSNGARTNVRDISNHRSSAVQTSAEHPSPSPTPLNSTDRDRIEDAREREDAHVEPDTFMDGFRSRWKAKYGYECSLIPNAHEQTKIMQQCAAIERDQLRASLDAYFTSTDKVVLDGRHPLGLFLRDPLRFLAKPIAAPEPAKVSPSFLCRDHEPPCKDLAEHTRVNREARFKVAQ